jgi:nitrogen fixation protein FixH
MTTTTTGARRLTGWHVLWILIGGFGIVFAVNGVMAWYAIETFPGLVSNDAYREGLDYNRTLAARAEQEKLGWQVDVALTGTGTTRAVTARFHDRDGHPISGLKVDATMVWPVAGGNDRRASLDEAAPGDYRATIALPSLGNWRLDVEAVRRDGTRWQMERSLWLR